MSNIFIDRLHPETLRTLEQLIKLHGAVKLITAICEINLAIICEVERNTDRLLCPNTGLPCLPSCNQKECAGLHMPLDQWPIDGA